ncbi:MAG TPA: PQQ-binding-like beta-propeller repeat protein [Gaiellaceae bacterium]
MIRPAAVVLGALLATCLLLASASAQTDASLNVGWGGFGNTPNEIRHSPLTIIDKGNVDQLGRLYTVNFQRIDPSVRRGQQSYPVEQGGVLYLTTNDDNVWALDALSGQVKWRYTPDDVAVFRNFGIVANRGVAVCDGHVFELTLDMTIVQLNQRTGALERRVPIAKAVPGASMNYGYSETSAPICANHRLIAGAAGSEYGVRGFVMAWRTNDLSPAWPNPFWTIPPAGTEWRRNSTLAGGGVVWTPTTVDTASSTLYFGTGSATPLYFPSIRPGSNPRADSLIAVNLATGRMKWWQQQMAHNEWSYDTAQPPLVYTAKVGGKKQRVVSVATMEGVWFAYDARSGRPIYERVKVIDRMEHPALKPGKPVAVFPSSLGGINYSPASFDPNTNYIFNGAAETAAIDVQTRLTPTQKKRKFTLGDVFLGLQNGNFGTLLPGWHDHGSISAIDVNSGRQVWKLQTPEPERGGIATTDSGLGFAGGGDGILRAFDVKNGKVLWKFQTGHQIASGVSIYSIAGKEYVAVTVGGTPTSSGGGTASELQVFALGASSNESPPPVLPIRTLQSAHHTAAPAAPTVAAAPRGVGRITTQAAIPVRLWQASSSNVTRVGGRVLLNGRPVAGARVALDGYRLPQATAKDGSFSTDVDNTSPLRRAVRVFDASRATVAGKRLSAGQQSALRAAQGGFSTSYSLRGVQTRRQGGNVVVTGRLVGANGQAPPTVRLLTYQLSGTITDASGKPVQGAVVITRTQDRDFWTHSSASDANGHYTSFFSASDETGANPVLLSVGLAHGGTSYGGNVGVNTNFAHLKSARLNIQLGSGTSYTLQTPTSYSGAVYSGLVVGVTAGGKVVKPLAAHWPDARGNFSLTLPGSVRGKTLHFWQNLRQAFSRFAARPGGPLDVRSWPAALGDATPQGLASLRVR